MSYLDPLDDRITLLEQAIDDLDTSTIDPPSLYAHADGSPRRLREKRIRADLRRLEMLKDRISVAQRRVEQRFAVIHNSTTSPGILPTDIIAAILKQVISTTATPRVHTQTQILTHICTLWRKVALAYPPLWARLRLMAFLGHEATLKMWLARAGQYPLEILMPDYESTERVFLDFASKWIVALRSRIHILGTTLDGPLLDAIRSHEFPVLKEARFQRGVDNGDLSVTVIAPHLRRLEILRIRPALQTFPGLQLHELVLKNAHHQPGELVVVLRQCPELKTLRLLSLYFSPPPTNTHIPQPLRFEVLSVNSLTVLGCEEAFVKDVLRHLSFPNVLKLRLRGAATSVDHPQSFSELYVHLIEESPGIQELTLAGGLRVDIHIINLLRDLAPRIRSGTTALQRLRKLMISGVFSEGDVRLAPGVRGFIEALRERQQMEGVLGPVLDSLRITKNILPDDLSWYLERVRTIEQFARLRASSQSSDW